MKTKDRRLECGSGAASVERGGSSYCLLTTLARRQLRSRIPKSAEQSENVYENKGSAFGVRQRSCRRGIPAQGGSWRPPLQGALGASIFRPEQ